MFSKRGASVQGKVSVVGLVHSGRAWEEALR